MKTYILFSKYDGGTYGKVEAPSFKVAREYFSGKISGNYAILCINTGKQRNVSLA